MILYRLTSGEHLHDLSGTGAKLYGGRWNSIGIPALYTTEHISLAVLEVLVHLKSYRSPLDYHLVTLDVPGNKELFASIDQQKLKKNWRDDIEYGRVMGDGFLTAGKSLALKVPSAIIDQEFNFIINPAHPEAKRIKIIASQNFSFDKRLYLKNE